MPPFKTHGIHINTQGCQDNKKDKNQRYNTVFYPGPQCTSPEIDIPVDIKKQTIGRNQYTNEESIQHIHVIKSESILMQTDDQGTVVVHRDQHMRIFVFIEQVEITGIFTECR